MSKRRIDAWDSALTEQQRWAAYDRVKRFKWFEVAAWIHDEFEIDPPSRAALYRFASEMRDQESAHRIESALSVKDDVRRQMAQVGDMDAELQYAYEQLAMESAMRGDEKAGIRYLDMATRYSQGKLERAKLDLKREAEARAQEALALDKKRFQRDTCELFVKWSNDKRVKEIVSSKGMADDRKVELLGQKIFGEDW